jgi:hypothetical protein
MPARVPVLGKLQEVVSIQVEEALVTGHPDPSRTHGDVPEVLHRGDPLEDAWGLGRARVAAWVEAPQNGGEVAPHANSSPFSNPAGPWGV